MSEENVEIVRGLLDGFNRRDVDAVYAAYDPEIKWDTTRMGTDGEVY